MWIRKMACLAALAMLAACGRSGNSVGEFSNDLLGNEIMVEALRDPQIPNVVCHLAYFDRSFLDRMRQGNWFEDPSNSAVTCQRIGPLVLEGVELERSGDEIFNQRASLLFKRLSLRRIVDLPNRTILYVAHSRELIEGSAKLSMSSVTLTEQEAVSVQR